MPRRKEVGLFKMDHNGDQILMFRGTVGQINTWVKDKDFTFRRDKNDPYGGHWVDDATGDQYGIDEIRGRRGQAKKVRSGNSARCAAGRGGRKNPEEDDDWELADDEYSPAQRFAIATVSIAEKKMRKRDIFDTSYFEHGAHIVSYRPASNGHFTNYVFVEPTDIYEVRPKDFKMTAMVGQKRLERQGIPVTFETSSDKEAAEYLEAVYSVAK